MHQRRIRESLDKHAKKKFPTKIQNAKSEEDRSFPPTFFKDRGDQVK
jgi:hypothetical protein